MACVRIPGGIMCGFYPWGRLHVGNRYIWVEFHPFCGPMFSTDRAMTQPYYPEDENDPVWPEFEKWHEKYKQAQAEKRVKRSGEQCG